MRRIILITTAEDLAADLVVLHLKRRGVDFYRFNQEDFPDRARFGWRGRGVPATMELGSEVVHCGDIQSAWFRHPVVPAISDQKPYSGFVARECAGFLSGFWEVMPWFWMNRPSAVAFASNKVQQLWRAPDFGLSVPDTVITNDDLAARNFVLRQDTVAKAVTNAGVSLADRQYVLYTNPITLGDVVDSSITAAPVILQRAVPNEFDLRVTVIGKRALAARIMARRQNGETDWRAVDASRVCYERYELPSELEARCIAFAESFSLTFAALDFIVTPDGEHVFLEINPSGQWGWLEQATGLPITEAIVDRLMEGTP